MILSHRRVAWVPVSMTLLASLAIACGEVRTNPPVANDAGANADDDAGAFNEDDGGNISADASTSTDAGAPVLPATPVTIGALQDFGASFNNGGTHTLVANGEYVYAGIYANGAPYETVARFDTSGANLTGETIITSADQLYAGGSIAVNGSTLFFMHATPDANGANYDGANAFDLTSKAVVSVSSSGTYWYGYDDIIVDANGRAYWQGGTSLMGWTKGATSADVVYAPGSPALFVANGNQLYFTYIDGANSVVASMATTGGSPVDYTTFPTSTAAGSGTPVLGVNGGEIFYLEYEESPVVKAVDMTTLDVRAAFTADPPVGGFTWEVGPCLFDDYIYFAHQDKQASLQRAPITGGPPEVLVTLKNDVITAFTVDATRVYYAGYTNLYAMPK